MKDKFFIDLGRMMDEIFDAAQNLGNAFKDGFACTGNFCWDEKVDFYPAYSYPPANVFITKDKHLVFEFALSGFNKEDISLLFQGDYMVLSVKAPGDAGKDRSQDVRFFKRRFKLKDIKEQKYYVPASRFDRNQVAAVYRNGLLTITIPPDTNFSKEEGIHVDIKEEDTQSTTKEEQE